MKDDTAEPQADTAAEAAPSLPEETASDKEQAPAEVAQTQELLAMPAPEPVARFDKRVEMRRLLISRRQNRTEEELRKELAWAPEVGLRPDDMPALIRNYETSFRTTFQIHADVSLQPTVLLDLRPDLARLPVRSGSACHISAKAAATLTTLSRKLRVYLERATPKDSADGRHDPVRLLQILREERRGKRPEWLRPEAIPVLLQLLTHEDRPLRLMLVELLAEIEGKPASGALARRAVFDLSPEVRETALVALRERPREDYREVLLQALLYPWAAAADHAAEALVALEDRAAVPRLLSLLQAPDPGMPRPVDTDRYVVREVVRINHQTNCLMCHAPAVTGKDPVPGWVPGVVLLGTRPESLGKQGYGGSRPRGPAPLRVRADVAFFRQDFSVQQLAPNPASPSETMNVRFDYLVRTRRLSAKEIQKITPPLEGKPGSGQRQALLFALRELTGQDLGRIYQDWLAVLPKPAAAADAEAARLAEQLVKASTQRQGFLLLNLKANKNPAAIQALALAIPRLRGDTMVKAREALADRLAQLSAADLREQLQNDNVELRRAAVAAGAGQGDKSLVPHLIPLLEDSEPAVARLVHRSLKTLTGRDLGPAGNAQPEAWAVAAAAWKAWWQQESGEAREELDFDSPWAP
jgi:HEAT repeat protein